MSVGRSAPLSRSTLAWRIVACVVAVGMALLCWNQIARNLGGPRYFPLQFDGDHVLPRPHGGTAVITDHLGTLFSLTGGSLLIAISIALLASAFAIGARLTRDTEGLV